jgi:hypothetical protein
MEVWRSPERVWTLGDETSILLLPAIELNTSARSLVTISTELPRLSDCSTCLGTVAELSLGTQGPSRPATHVTRGETWPTVGANMELVAGHAMCHSYNSPGRTEEYFIQDGRCPD